MKKSFFSLGALAVVLAFILSTVFSSFLMEHPDDRDKEFSLMLAGRVNDVVTDEILRPLLVSRTMSNDNLLAEWLQQEDQHTLSENVLVMQKYLSRLKDEFGYTSAFLISEKSRCYYTYRGFNKILNPLDDPHDKWYPTFIKKNLDFELNADTDQVNGNHWTIFINCRITAPDGTLLGVCGVGVVMDHLRQIMEEYEKQYGVKINLVDSNGLVQMAVDYSDMTLEELWELFPIFLVEHDDKWLGQYEEIEGRLAELLSGCAVGRISHIGSTAVDGIWAKDIVDVMVELPGQPDLDRAAETLGRSGFTVMSDEGKRVSLNLGYTKDGFAEKVYHVHLRLAGDNDELYFRDYLNAYPQVAREYEALKLRLWREFEHDRDAYTEAKSEFIKAVTARARRVYAGRY